MKTETYDILIAGASTTGAWFAKKKKKRGHKVLVIEKQKEKDVSREYDIFHMEKYEMQKFGITLPNKDDVEYGFEFGSTGGKSPYGNYEKIGVGNPIVGMHKHEMIMRLNKEAEAAGAKYGYKVTFRGPTAESEEYVNQQREMVQTALNNKDTKALVLATIGLGFADELTSAFDKKLPVVEFDSGLYSGGADITAEKDPTVGGVATDNRAAGGVVAENFYAYLKNNGLAVDGYKVGIIQHDSTSTGIDRAAGFKEKIEELAKADNIALDINVQVKANNAGEYKLNGKLEIIETRI